MAAPRHISLLGLTGVGKTSVGSELASLLGWPHLDCDRLIEERFGRSGRDIAASEGVARLHAIEYEATVEMLITEPPAVVGAPASVLDHNEGRALIAERSRPVWLNAPAAVLGARMRSQSHRRPIDESELARLLEERRDHFRALAEIELDTSTPSPKEIARSIVAELGLGSR